MVDSGLETKLWQPAWLRAAMQPASLLCLLMIAALWIGLTFILMIERQRTLELAIQKGGSLARLFEENTASMLREVDRTLLLLRRAYEQDPAQDLSRWVIHTSSSDNLIFQYSIAGQDGYARALTSNYDSGPPTYVGDRELFDKAARRQPR